MPFGIIGRTGSGTRQVVGFDNRSTGRNTFGGAFGARHCNQWGLYSVRVRHRRDAALFPNYFGQTCLDKLCAHLRPQLLNLPPHGANFKLQFGGELLVYSTVRTASRALTSNLVSRRNWRSLSTFPSRTTPKNASAVTPPADVADVMAVTFGTVGDLTS